MWEAAQVAAKYGLEKLHPLDDQNGLLNDGF